MALVVNDVARGAGTGYDHTVSRARLATALEASLALRLQNPFQRTVRQAMRAVVAARLMPPPRAEMAAWSTWWRGLPRVLRSDRAAALALFVGVGEGYPLEGGQRRMQAAAEWIAGPCDAAAELASRSLRVRDRLERIVGISPAIRSLRAAAWAAAFGDRLDRTLALGSMLQSTPVLILGETGSGKELIAQALCAAAPGAWSNRGGYAAGHADAVNLASLPDDLIFSALFGHRRGAYTGAGGDRAGVLEQCDGGAVFLDEVADLPLKAQVALLRSLQEGRVRPLGADVDVAAAPRVISATHRDLTAAVARGTFRIDLYYRLSSVVLQVPPLRERTEDLPLLAETILRAVEPELRPVILERFQGFLAGPGADYRWPGNVRELAAVLRTLALGLEPRLLDLADTRRPDLPLAIQDGDWTLDEVKRWYVRQVAELHPTRAAAARQLDIDRGTLRTLLKT